MFPLGFTIMLDWPNAAAAIGSGGGGGGGSLTTAPLTEAPGILGD